MAQGEPRTELIQSAPLSLLGALNDAGVDFTVWGNTALRLHALHVGVTLPPRFDVANRRELAVGLGLSPDNLATAFAVLQQLGDAGQLSSERSEPLTAFPIGEYDGTNVTLDDAEPYRTNGTQVQIRCDRDGSRSYPHGSPELTRVTVGGVVIPVAPLAAVVAKLRRDADSYAEFAGSFLRDLGTATQRISAAAQAATQTQRPDGPAAAPPRHGPDLPPSVGGTGGAATPPKPRTEPRR